MQFTPQKENIVAEFYVELQRRREMIQLNLEKIKVKGETILKNSKALHFLIELKELIITSSLHSERLKEQDQIFLDPEPKENYLYLYFQDLLELSKLVHENGFISESEWLLKIAKEKSDFFAARAPVWLGVANLFARLYLTATVEDFVEQGTDELKETVRNSQNYNHPLLWHILFTDYIQQKTEFMVSYLQEAERAGKELNPEGLWSALQSFKSSIPHISLVPQK